MAEQDIIPGKQHSLWIDTSEEGDFPYLNEDKKVEVAVIGGGITGVTTAFLLKQAGMKVALIEAGRLCSGTTGFTTAKVTSQHGFLYPALKRKFGSERTAQYFKAQEEAKEFIAALVKNEKIECDFAREASYNYTEKESGIKAVEEFAQVFKSVGANIELVEKTSLPFPIKAAVKLENQIRFHSRKYVLELAKKIPGDGSFVFESTRALGIIPEHPYEIITDRGRVKAEKVVEATQFPFYDRRFFFARLYPSTSYVLGVYVKDVTAEGMYFSQDDTKHSIRYQPSEKGPILIVSGSGHTSGQGGDTMRYYKQVEKYARQRFDFKSVDYFWSAEDYQTADLLPFIGKRPVSRGTYVATGFNKWGMTNGTLAALINSDLILGEKNPYANLFNPSHIYPHASISTAFSKGLNISNQYLKGYLSRHPKEKPSQLDDGEAKLIKDNGIKASFKDENGNEHEVSATCTHFFCRLNWNNAELTWDCPCHGSRFSKDGGVIHGPAKKDLRSG